MSSKPASNSLCGSKFLNSEIRGGQYHTRSVQGFCVRQAGILPSFLYFVYVNVLPAYKFVHHVHSWCP